MPFTMYGRRRYRWSVATAVAATATDQRERMYDRDPRLFIISRVNASHSIELQIGQKSPA